MPGPLAAIGSIGAVAEAIKEITKLVGGYLSGKTVRKLKYRVEAAMSYVHVDRKEGEFKSIDDKKQESLKVHYAKRIFDE